MPARLVKLLIGLIVATILAASPTHAQQVADPSFNPPIAKPAYKEGRGPVVLLDEAHFNFHTASGRYLAFAELLRRDGYVVLPSKAKFSRESLQAGKILVIANALSERNQTNWSPPWEPGFTDEEIAAVRQWVEDGGALMMMVDHLPMPVIIDKLAFAFGIHFSNGYALKQNAQGGQLVFNRAEGLLKDHPITRGRTANEKVDSVATFTGSAFRIDEGAEPLLVLGPSMVSYLLTTFGEQITPETRHIPVGGWYQGAVMRVGKGRVAVFGEAAMFSAQLAGPNRQPMGMNAPVAVQNPQFLLNVLHWLSGRLKK